MTDFEYIFQQVKKFHFSGWNDEELRKCVDMLPTLSREEQLALYRSKWIEHEKALKEAIFNQLFKERIEERDRRIKAMSVDELIENLYDENGYGKFIVLEMKDRFDSLEDKDKVKIIDNLSVTTKANQRWAEGKKKKMKKGDSTYG
jgi:Cdc6-like AAA superfamily ATPase